MTIRTVLILIVSLLCFPTNARDVEVWKFEAHTNQGSLRLLGVEKALMQDSTRAVALLKVIPEAVFQEKGSVPARAIGNRSREQSSISMQHIALKG